MSVSPPPIRWMSPPPVYDAPPVSNSGLTPYLQLSHILSLVWLAYPILSLMFIAFRLHLSSASAQRAIDNAKGDFLSGCLAAQRAASSAASLPRFMAVATNEQISDAINASMRGAREALVLSLTVMEAIINFVVDTYRSTFLCFWNWPCINSFLTNTLGSLRTSIQNDVAAANSAIQTTINGINKLNPFGNITAPQFSIPSLDSLQNVTLPTDFQDSLTKLNASLPSIAVLKHTVNDLLDTPFELVKAEINTTFAGLSFNSSILPVPDRSTVTFCDDLDTSLVDDLARGLLKLANIGLVLIAILILLLLVGYSLLEWYKWRSLKRHLEYTRKAWVADPTVVHIGPASAPMMTLSDHNLLMLHADSTHPLLTRLAYKLSALFRLSRSHHINLCWFFRYIFHPPALTCFLIGFFGILSVELQLLALSPLEAKFRDRATGAINDLSGTIFASLNQTLYNQSAIYANDINTHIDSIQSTINDEMFGWVNGTTTTLNDTINTFYNDLQDTVSTFFNGSFLQQPAQEFIRCIIGSKVIAIENALTFLHDNLHVNISRVNASILVLSPDEVNVATRPIAAAAVGTGDKPDSGLLGRLIETYKETLRKERVMFAIFLGLWFIVVLMGLAIIFWHSYGRHIFNSRGKRNFQRDQRTGSDGIKSKEGNSASPYTAPTPIPIRRVEPSDPEGLHSLSNVPPAASRSFDSFFDHASPVAVRPPETEGKFRRLSRKLQQSGWRKHLTLALRSDKGAVRKSFHKAHRPQLTISTGRAASSRRSSLPEVERTSPGIINAEVNQSSRMRYEPKSGWSATPETAWMPTINPGTRRKPSVPVSVGPEAESAAPSPAAVALAQFVVPLQVGVARSAPAHKLYIPPTPTAGRAARARAQVENPFVTPFDDDARVLHSPVPVSAVSMTADVSFMPPFSGESEFAEMSFATGRAL
ncbi:hypothetical protein BC826DRAFT_1098652 [Russula brevipes]|nr:hypothetical protein BC826DRAFT_1098652 [Russula brevipes]